MCRSRGRARTSRQSPSPASTRTRCARRAFRSSATSSTANPGGPTRRTTPAGYDGGVADAQTALRLHAAAGGTGSAPIFFSVDDDIDLNTWNSVAVNGFGESTRYWAWAAPVSTDMPTRVAGQSGTA